MSRSPRVGTRGLDHPGWDVNHRPVRGRVVGHQRHRAVEGHRKPGGQLAGRDRRVLDSERGAPDSLHRARFHAGEQGQISARSDDDSRRIRRDGGRRRLHLSPSMSSTNK